MKPSRAKNAEAAEAVVVAVDTEAAVEEAAAAALVEVAVAVVDTAAVEEAADAAIGIDAEI
jgi:hypothetical protein